MDNKVNTTELAEYYIDKNEKREISNCKDEFVKL
jgi:hypothetical protein